MTTKKKTRPHRAAKNNISKNKTSRYTTQKTSLAVSDETTEQSWIVFVLGLFVLLGIVFISAISYILLLG